tara:strand:- start:170 stop:826 length:657 start_codon:yes stop_codon:yes gene_type:complete
MISKEKCIAIITAREGSKRIKNKNIISFFGKPIISYSIKAAKKSKLFQDIIVSTDSKKIKKVSLQYGASVPFLRSKKLADDKTGTHEVVKNFLKNSKKKYDYVCCIYPTAPLIRYKDLIKGYEKLKKNKSKYIFSANLVEKSKKKFFTRGQNKFEDSGQFYWGTYNKWMKNSNLIGKESLIIKIPLSNAHDLNDFDDLKILQKKSLKLKIRNKKYLKF